MGWQISNPNGAMVGAGRSTNQVIEMTRGATSNLTTGAVQDGALAGQRQIIMNRLGSTGTIAIPHVSTFNTDLDESNVANAPGYSLTPICDGRTNPGVRRWVPQVRWLIAC